METLFNISFKRNIYLNIAGLVNIKSNVLTKDGVRLAYEDVIFKLQTFRFVTQNLTSPFKEIFISNTLQFYFLEGK